MNRVILIFLTALTLVGAVSADDKTTDALIQKAVSAGNLKRGDVPFVLQASVKLMNVKNKPTGNYDILYLSPREWRESLSTDGYNESAVVKDGWMWKTRPSQYDSLPVRVLHAALESAKDFEGTAQRILEKTWNEKVGGVPVVCASYRLELISSELCADPATGNLMRVKGAGFETELYNHSEFQGRSIPRFVSVKWQGRQALNLTIDTLRSPSQGEQVQLPAIGKQAPYCPSTHFTIPSLPKAGRVNPHYPEEARRNRVKGRVEIAVLIRENGTVSPVAVIESAGRLLDESTLQTIRQWRYIPATCDGRPIDHESFIIVNYELRGD